MRSGVYVAYGGLMVLWTSFAFSLLQAASVFLSSG
jgi:hypothetical protein